MDAKTFADKLSEIEEDTRQKITNLVHLAQKEDGLDWDTDKPISFSDDSNWQRKADALAELAGWIYDRMNGHTRLYRKSVTRKIRKALGYTYS